MRKRRMVSACLVVALTACSAALASRYARTDFEGPEEWGDIVSTTTFDQQSPGGSHMVYLVVAYKHEHIAWYTADGELVKVMTRVEKR